MISTAFSPGRRRPGVQPANSLCASVFLGVLSLLSICGPAAAQDSFSADVVLVVDTSRSMLEPGMDPERTSLLVSKLFSDIVPGKLAVLRLMSAGQDKDAVGMVQTGEFQPCREDPSQNCSGYTLPPEKQRELAEGRIRVGEKLRPQRGSAAFKSELDQHLEPVANSSYFGYSFATAGSIFEQNRAEDPDRPQVLIWLSDGRAEDWESAKQTLKKLQSEGVGIEAIVFGRGSTDQAAEAGLPRRTTTGPAELMSAFADAFRRVVRAPFRADSRVSAKPRFSMKPEIEEAWVVIFGDTTLSRASVVGPSGEVLANFAEDQQPRAGAYKVAYLSKPTPGDWEVRASGGGADVSYAVIERSSLAPFLLEPRSVIAGVPSTLVVALRSSEGGADIRPADLGEDVKMEARFEGQTVELRDDGVAPDATAGDGRFAATITLAQPGQTTVRVRASNSFIDRSNEGVIEVSGMFRYTGGPVALDFGSLKAGEQACLPLVFSAEHVGSVPLELKALEALPSGHALELHAVGGATRPGGEALLIGPADEKQLCLVTERRAPSSSSDGRRWAEIRMRGREDAEAAVPLELTWQVEGLSFWELYKWWILGILGFLVLAFILYGFIKPHNFPRELALIYVPELADLEDNLPQPIRSWKGTGKGWYRNAQAYLTPDFRITGSKKGALVSLEAVGARSVLVKGLGGGLYRDGGDGDWDEVPEQGRRIRGGELYRIGERGPFFQTATRMGR